MKLLPTLDKFNLIWQTKTSVCKVGRPPISANVLEIPFLAQVICTMVGLINDYNDDYDNNNSDKDITCIELLLYTCFTNIIHLIFMTSQYFQSIFYTTVYCKML